MCYERVTCFQDRNKAVDGVMWKYTCLYCHGTLCNLLFPFSIILEARFSVDTVPMLFSELFSGTAPSAGMPPSLLFGGTQTCSCSGLSSESWPGHK